MMNSTYEHIKNCIEVVKDGGEEPIGLTLFAHFDNEIWVSFKGVNKNMNFLMPEMEETEYSDVDEQEEHFGNLVKGIIKQLITEDAFLPIIKHKPFPVFYQFWDSNKILIHIFKAKNPQVFFPEIEEKLELKIPDASEYNREKWWRIIIYRKTGTPKFRYLFEEGHVEFKYKDLGYSYTDFHSGESVKEKEIKIEVDSDDFILKLWDVPHYDSGFIVSYKLMRLLKKLNVNNIEVFPVKLTDIVREESTEFYYKAVNILGKSDAFVYYDEYGKQCKESIPHHHQIKGIKNKLEQLDISIVRPTDKRHDIVVTDYIKVACELNKLSGLYFEEIPNTIVQHG